MVTCHQVTQDLQTHKEVFINERHTGSKKDFKFKLFDLKFVLTKYLCKCAKLILTSIIWIILMSSVCDNVVFCNPSLGYYKSLNLWDLICVELKTKYFQPFTLIHSPWAKSTVRPLHIYVNNNEISVILLHVKRHWIHHWTTHSETMDFKLRGEFRSWAEAVAISQSTTGAVKYMHENCLANSCWRTLFSSVLPTDRSSLVDWRGGI